MRFLPVGSRLVFLSLFLLPLGGALATERQTYGGQEGREIKALSQERTNGLLAGAGLGYAKAAELNGWPGPLHVLELADTLRLSAKQSEEVSLVRESMLQEAKRLGLKLVEGERQLETLFATGNPLDQDIDDTTAKIAAVEGQLRAVHLRAHLKMVSLLSRHQIMLYNRERGYSGHAHSSGHGIED